MITVVLAGRGGTEQFLTSLVGLDMIRASGGGQYGNTGQVPQPMAPPRFRTSTRRNLSQGNNQTGVLRETCARVLIAAVLMTAQTWKGSKHPAVEVCQNKDATALGGAGYGHQREDPPD